MRKNESRWRSRQRGYHALAAGGGLFGVFLLLGGLTPGAFAWFFGVLAFVGLIAGCRQALKLWNVDDLVFEHRKQWRPAPAGNPEVLRFPAQRLPQSAAK